MANLMTAANEYARRPKDERFESIDAYLSHAEHQKQSSAERVYNAKDLRVVEAPAQPAGQGFIAHEHRVKTDNIAPEKATTLMIESPRARAMFTHWSFGQLCRTVEAPASYLRTLPPAIAADALNHGLKTTAFGTDLKLLVQAPNGNPHATVRACTSDSYARAWDADLMQQLRREMGHDDRWTPPPTWDKNPDGSAKTGGLYRGDRDSFAMLINGGSIVNDPSAMGGSGSTGSGNDGAMYRGVMVRNSEVGAASITIETVLYRYICGNHILWGAALDTTFRRRHTGKNAVRDSIRELSRIAYNYTNASSARDEQIIRTLIDKQIAATKEGVIDELRKIGASKDLAARAYELVEQTENLSPRSYWGAIQGLTRASQEDGYQDLRLETDLLAAQLLKLGQRVAA